MMGVVFLIMVVGMAALITRAFSPLDAGEVARRQGAEYVTVSRNPAAGSDLAHGARHPERPAGVVPGIDDRGYLRLAAPHHTER